MARAISAGVPLAVLVVSLIQGSAAVNLEETQERPCFKVEKFAQLDLSWVASQKWWHYEIMTRFDLFGTAVGFLNKPPEEVTEDMIYYGSCARWRFDEGKFIGYMYGTRKETKTAMDGGFDKMIFGGNGEPRGEVNAVFTDNKTYVAWTVCWVDLNQMTFGALSTVYPLPKETVKEIQDGAVALGFKRNYLTRLEYDEKFCGPIGKQKIVYDEL